MLQFISSETHRKHHVNCNTNYGIEQWDILFNSMYDNNFEDINHYSITILNYLYIAHIFRHVRNCHIRK